MTTSIRPARIAVLFDLLRTINVFISEQKLEGLQDEQRGNWALNRDALRKALTLLKELGGLLGLFRAPVAKPSGGDDDLTGQLASLVSGIRTEAAHGEHASDSRGGR